jgi:glycosyltransferase involved in cell wall biosynthesis
VTGPVLRKGGITVVIPTIPPRGKYRLAAIGSALRQNVQPDAVIVELDRWHAGAAVTRNRALAKVDTEWVAFLDDDDLLYPEHLETLMGLADGHMADFVYSWFDGNDPFPGNRGKAMDPEHPHHTTMTVMVRTELARQVGGFRTDWPKGWDLPQEDWRFITDCVAAGAVFAGTDDVTWHYRVHGAHTSGLGGRW